MGSNGKDGWDKLQSLGGLFSALAVASIGLVGSQALSRQQTLETNARLYTELMSKREEAESSLRKDMFVSIIGTFLTPTSHSLEAKLLQIELLAYNFHESLNLKPLFVHLQREIAQSRDPEKDQYEKRLHKVAREITRKQLLILEGAGTKYDRAIPLTALRASQGKPLSLEEMTGALGDHGARKFKVMVLGEDPKAKEIKIRLTIVAPNAARDGAGTTEAEFSIGYFDFPMIDNTRLSRDERFAIVLSDFEEENAEITAVHFPGAYASLKEKPYLHEVAQSLLTASAPNPSPSPPR